MIDVSIGRWRRKIQRRLIGSSKSFLQREKSKMKALRRYGFMRTKVVHIACRVEDELTSCLVLESHRRSAGEIDGLLARDRFHRRCKSILFNWQDLIMSEQGSMGARSASDLDRLHRAAETLTPLERNVLGLSAGRGMLIKDIALTLGLSERRTERIFVKALNKFDMALHGEKRPWWHFW